MINFLKLDRSELDKFNTISRTNCLENYLLHKHGKKLYSKTFYQKKIWVFGQTQLLLCSHVFCRLCTIFNEKYINVNLEWFCCSISPNGSSSTPFCEELEHPEKGRQPTTNSTHFRMHGQRKWEGGEEKIIIIKQNTHFTIVCMINFS